MIKCPAGQCEISVLTAKHGLEKLVACLNNHSGVHVCFQGKQNQFFIHIGHELSFTLPFVKSKYRMVLMKGCVLSKS